MTNNFTVCYPLDTFFIPCNDKIADFQEISHTIAFKTLLIIIAILSPVAVVGNALILAAIWKKTFHRTPLHVLLSGLAPTDLCTGLVSQPLTIAVFSLYGVPSLVATTIQRVSTASSIYFISVTLLIITLLSVERWLHMFQPQRSFLKARRGCVTAILVFLTPIPIAVLHSGKTINNLKSTWLGVELEMATLAVIVICFLTTCVAYFNVFSIIRRHRKQVQARAPSQDFGQPEINLAKYEKSVRTILCILALFCFCFLPFIISYAAYIHLGASLRTALATSISIVLLFLSSSLNPCLYLWRMNDIRNGVKQFFGICQNNRNSNRVP